MRNFSLIILVLFAFVFSNAKAQSVPGELSPETRANIASQMESLKSWYPVKNSEKQMAPPVMNMPVSDAELKTILRKDACMPLASEDLVLEILRFYTTQYFDECKYLLAMAELQAEYSTEAFRKNNVPEELMYLALVKSGMNPEYSSSAGALGTWQFMYSTGRLYHLRIDEYIDERREIKRSSEAAAWMLKDLHNLYNDWPLAVTAYSCGPGNINKAIRKAGGEKSFEALYQYLPSPERDLYPSFLAIQLMVENPVMFGLEPETISYPQDGDTVMIDQDLHIGQVAEVVGLDETLLCQLNPVYPQKIVPGKDDDALPLVLPEGNADKFSLLKDSIFAYKDSLFFNIKPEVTEEEKAKQTPDPYTPGKGFVPVDYTIKSGDNLGYISSWFDTNISEIRYWNGIHGNSIRAGQKLVIYVAQSKESYYSVVDKLTFQQKQAREGKIVQAEKRSAPVQEVLKPGEYIIYTVKSGDNPWKIAKQYPGVSDQDILRWNSIDAKGLRPGQKLKIKKVTTT